MRRIKAMWMAAAVATLLGVNVASAEAEGWTFALTPYGWLPQMNGDVSIGPVSAPVDLSFSDTLDLVKDIKGALMLHGLGLGGRGARSEPRAVRVAGRPVFPEA